MAISKTLGAGHDIFTDVNYIQGADIRSIAIEENA
jgi:hypothetical protein